MLCSGGIQEMHILRAVGHELIKVADSICISHLQPPNLFWRLQVLQMFGMPAYCKVKDHCSQ